MVKVLIVDDGHISPLAIKELVALCHDAVLVGADDVNIQELAERVAIANPVEYLLDIRHEIEAPLFLDRPNHVSHTGRKRKGRISKW